MKIRPYSKSELAQAYAPEITSQAALNRLAASMTRGERHAYEEHLTNVVILEDAIETAEEIGKL